MSHRKPIVLVFAGHDPTGAAGVQADIESIVNTGCQSISLLTSITAQNTAELTGCYPQKPDRFRQQADLLLADMPVDACKIGLIGAARLAEIIADLLMALRPMPVVLDPIIATGTGQIVSVRETVKAILEKLLPLTTVLTPNADEARRLTGTDNLPAAADRLFEYGCEHVLVTGADAATRAVTNVLFSRDAQPLTYEWERLPGQYHGSGCTLSAAIAGYLALGIDIRTAVEKAQRFTWECLKHGIQYGKNQGHPNRFHTLISG